MTDEWPRIPVTSPKAPESVWVSGVMEKTPENLDELMSFYETSMLPQLVCRPDGGYLPFPTRKWVEAEGREVVVVRDTTGALRGCWIIRDNGIFFPCATVEDISGIFRALWDETIKHYDYLWGSTQNELILKFAQAAVRKEKTPGRPTITLTEGRIEWRRPT